MKNIAKTYSICCLDIYYFIIICFLNRQQISWKNIDWRQQRYYIHYTSACKLVDYLTETFQPVKYNYILSRSMQLIQYTVCFRRWQQQEVTAENSTHRYAAGFNVIVGINRLFPFIYIYIVYALSLTYSAQQTATKLYRSIMGTQQVSNSSICSHPATVC